MRAQSVWATALPMRVPGGSVTKPVAVQWYIWQKLHRLAHVFTTNLGFNCLAECVFLVTRQDQQTLLWPWVEQGEVGGWAWRVQTLTAWPSLGSALERSWLALGGLFLYSYAQMGRENSPFVPFLAVKLSFPAWMSDWWPRAMTIESLLMGEYGLSHKCVEDSYKNTGVKFGCWKLNIPGDMV